ncbi:hypothetical protein SH528x_002128 [Novipirellula sp. SH528]|uniref:hypothetical protein n=1 Tax=Novipirellula sp. SH528 TaxID=3454466 RepID=UPI003F9FAAED
MTERELLDAIENRLVDVVPRAMESASIPQPIYATVIQYFGLDSVGDLTPNLRMPTCSRRTTIISEKGETAPHYIWCHDEFDDDHLVIDATLNDAELSTMCSTWYDSLRSSTTTLSALRKTVQRASRRLNDMSERFANLPLSDDFVVYPGDMAHEFDDPFSDLSASVDANMLAKFRDLRLIGADTWWKL